MVVETLHEDEVHLVVNEVSMNDDVTMILLVQEHCNVVRIYSLSPLYRFFHY